MEDVELQPYAIETIKRLVPMLRRKVDEQHVVRRLRPKADSFTVRFDGTPHADYEVTFNCPAMFRELFYRSPGVHASEKVCHLLQSSYESWMAQNGIKSPIINHDAQSSVV